MAFTADLNPKKSSMDLGDLLKMDEAITKKRYYDEAMGNKTPKVAPKKPAPVIDKSTPYEPNDMLRSSADDVGTQFRFNNSQSE